MVVVYLDVAFLVVLQYGVGETLADGDVLFVRGGGEGPSDTSRGI